MHTACKPSKRQQAWHIRAFHLWIAPAKLPGGNRDGGGESPGIEDGEVAVKQETRGLLCRGENQGRIQLQQLA